MANLKTSYCCQGQNWFWSWDKVAFLGRFNTWNFVNRLHVLHFIICRIYATFVRLLSEKFCIFLRIEVGQGSSVDLGISPWNLLLCAQLRQGSSKELLRYCWIILCPFWTVSNVQKLIEPIDRSLGRFIDKTFDCGKRKIAIEQGFKVQEYQTGI